MGAVFKTLCHPFKNWLIRMDVCVHGFDYDLTQIIPNTKRVTPKLRTWVSNPLPFWGGQKKTKQMGSSYPMKGGTMGLIMVEKSHPNGQKIPMGFRGSGNQAHSWNHGISVWQEPGFWCTRKSVEKVWTLGWGIPLTEQKSIRTPEEVIEKEEIDSWFPFPFNESQHFTGNQLCPPWSRSRNVRSASPLCWERPWTPPSHPPPWGCGGCDTEIGWLPLVDLVVV